MRLLLFLSIFFFTGIIYAQTPVLTASQEATNAGGTVTIYVTVDSLENAVSMQFTLSWDSDILSYQSTGDYGLTSLSEFNFGETQVTEGILPFVWFDGQVGGVTLADGSTIFSVTFNAIGEVDEVSGILFVNSPTPIQIGVVDGTNIDEVPSLSVDGQVQIISNDIILQSDILSIDCFGAATGSIDIEIEGGLSPYEFSWLGPNGFTSADSSLQDLLAGEYSVTVSDQLGNTFSETYTITQIAAIQVDELLINATDCNQPTGSVTLFVSGGMPDYSYDYGDGFISEVTQMNLAAGSFTLFIQDAANCQIDTLIEIIEVGSPSVSLGEDSSICFDGELLLSAGTDNTLTYEWLQNGSSLTETMAELLVSEAASYEVLVTNEQGCTARDTIIINEIAAPIINLGQDTFFCTNGSLLLSVTAGLNYEWFLDDNLLSETNATLTVNEAGTYSVTVTSIDACIASDTIQVNAAANPVINLGPDRSVCPKMATTLFADMGFATYEWFLNDTSYGENDAEVEATEQGTYAIIATDNNGCIAMDTVLLTELNISTTAGPDTTITVGDSVQLFATGGGTYQWMAHLELSCYDCPNPIATPSETTIFQLMITSEEGCVSEEFFTIEVADKSGLLVDIVNFLSPNGDGKNDMLIFRGLENYLGNQLSIFNRWGDLLFSKPNYQHDGIFWEATFKGKPLPAGVYYYVLKLDQVADPIRSSLTIVRN